MDRDFLKLYSMYFFFALAHIFGWTLSSMYFLQKGFSPAQIAIYFALSFVVAAAFVAYAKGLDGKKSIQRGIILRMLIFLLAAWLASRQVFFLMGAIWGIMMISFWVPLNVEFYRFGAKGKNAAHSGSYFMMWPLLGALVPVLSGASAAKYGMVPVFLAGAAILLPGLAMSKRIKEIGKITFNFKRFIKNTKGVKTLIFIQGISEGIEWVVVPIATFFFITQEVEYGAFYSYLGIFGLAAFLLVARISDRMKKRAVFLVPVSLALGASTIMSGVASGLAEWVVWRGLASFLVSIFSPFALTVVVDVSKRLEDTMVSREFFLNTGRAVGSLVVAGLAVLSQDIKLALVFSGAALLFYPVFLLRKRKYYGVKI